LGIFHEHVANKVLKDCVKAVAPKWMIVTGIFNSRGGIQTTVVAKYGV
jgi:7-cyano-7-deazaguanine reductase